MQCPQCQAENREGRRFCKACGAPLTVACPGCGFVNEPDERFCGGCGVELTTAAATTAAAAPAPREDPRERQRAEAERRQLTVLFCDLVGSTELAGRLDPEDLREVIRRYQECCAAVVAAFDGSIASYMGDGVLVYFGYPHAHEDDAERAVRAGLELVEEVGRLRPRADVALQARVGIATGLVVVGDLIGAGGVEENAAGETPNLAARLQALAEPGSVVISPSTHRLSGGAFEYADLGPHRLKGFAEPVRVWRVLGPSAAEGRFEARQTTGLTPLVGREHEIGLLLDRWTLAREGDGQVVLLAGEPGIGKSRIVRALRKRLNGEPCTLLRYQCSPYHANSALYPIVEQLERAAGFQREDTAEAKLAKLEALLARWTERVDEVAPLFAPLLSIPTGDRYPPLELSPQRRKERLFEALVAQLDGLAAKQPVLQIFEDVHWIDPTSREFLGLIVDRVQGLRALTLVTFRPEFAPPWTGYAHVTSLSLSRLGRRQVSAMVERLTGDKALPPEVLDQIITKTDGVPLFVEELTKTVLESGLLRDAGGRFELAGPLPPLAIPATLQDSLMARLDRLAPVKEVAQVGAALGREFAHELLAAVAPLDETRLRLALDQLVAAELIFRRGAPPAASYVFKHALVQDAAYESLLRSRRQQLHARIAQVLETRFPEIAEAQPEVLAHHCTRAGLTEKAIDGWQRAGEQAIERSAITEAVTHLSHGLELLASLPDRPEHRRRELSLQTALGRALIAARGYSAPATGAAFTRARELCEQVGDATHLLPILFGQWAYHLLRAEVAVAHEVAEDMLAVAEREEEGGDTTARLIAHRLVGTTSFWLGRFAAARAHLERALTLYDPERHRTLAHLYMFDPKVVGLDFISLTLLALGYPEQALVRGRQALAEARALGHVVTLAPVLQHACLLHQFTDDPRTARERAEELLALATEHDFPFWVGHGTFLRGWALTALGETERGMAAMRDGVAAIRATNSALILPCYLAVLAEACNRLGEPAEGLPLLADALARVDQTGERWIEAELHRLEGELALAAPPEPDPAAAEGAFHRALAVARRQEAKLFELRAATCLARLWRDQGRAVEARDLLAPIYGWFSEGQRVAAALREARTLLDDLGWRPDGSDSGSVPPPPDIGR